MPLHARRADVVSKLGSMKDFEHIRVILKELLSDHKRNDPLTGSLTLLRWRKVVGSQISKQAQPEWLRDGVLQVRVENSVWLNHLRFLGEELRQKLNGEHPSLEIKKIRFRQGPLDSFQPPPSSTTSRPAPARQIRPKPVAPLSSEQHSLLEKITDRELRLALEALLKRQKERSHT